MADKVNVTVKKNWKKKIEAICNITTGPVKSYSLSSNFSGVTLDTITPESLLELVNKEIGFRSRLTYNKDNGAVCLHVHSNQWYSWVNKINW